MALSAGFKRLIEKSLSSTIKIKPTVTRNVSNVNFVQPKWKKNKYFKVGVYVSAAVGIGYGIYIANTANRHLYAKAKPQHAPIRQIKNAKDSSGLKLTLYQYQTCPFCTKVRTYLDFMGLSYDIVEVNSVWRTEMKWSKYKKVPVLLVDGIGEDGFLQLNDSSLIISVLDSYLLDTGEDFNYLMKLFPAQEVMSDKGKPIWHFPTRYNLVQGGSQRPDYSTSYDEAIKEERKWRTWTDDWLVHVLSPNIYKTPSQALESFRYFDQVGEWDKVFSSFQRSVVIYVGAAAMYVLGKHLKRKYKLDDDVRYSLYKACTEWTRAVKKDKRTFMGGDKPNLADLAVYGALNAIEGCQAWEDTKKNTDIEPWYNATKNAIAAHVGAHALTHKPVSQSY